MINSEMFELEPFIITHNNSGNNMISSEDVIDIESKQIEQFSNTLSKEVPIVNHNNKKDNILKDISNNYIKSKEHKKNNLTITKLYGSMIFGILCTYLLYFICNIKYNTLNNIINYIAEYHLILYVIFFAFVYYFFNSKKYLYS